MTNEQLLRYFENRPSLTEIYLVGTVVFVDEKAAKKYAAQVKGLVVSKLKKTIQDAYEKDQLDLDDLSPEEAKAKVLSMELNDDSDYYQLQDLVRILELPHEGRAREAYLAALLNYKATNTNPE
ncbi:hypothetical protein [uncultured Draconibacterium sp.]|uniref:hypothetical protein n=1 Tax=uncultured Draconibacterium sp. TaxID=1573823 RepID=UPI0025FD4C15|nr:hypothetical protein [uncultured Draconibacterium sp.]